jgi:hypothetical protein
MNDIVKSMICTLRKVLQKPALFLPKIQQFTKKQFPSTMAVRVFASWIFFALSIVEITCYSRESNHHSRKLLQIFDPSFPFLIVLSLSFLGLVSCLFQFRHTLFSMKQSAKAAKTPFSSDFGLYQSSV